jgi:hypothetical protein
MPFKIEKSIKIMSLFPSFSSQLHTLLDDPRIVAWAYNILKIIRMNKAYSIHRITLFILKRILLRPFSSLVLHLDLFFIFNPLLLYRINQRPPWSERKVVSLSEDLIDYLSLSGIVLLI